MKTLLILLILFGFTFSANTKHLFWYKCIQNNYRITDSANGFGPNIQGDVIKHEGKAFTATIRGSAGGQDPHITLGNGLDNAQARSSVFWYKDLCDLKLSPGTTLKSAKFRGEYRDNWGGNAFCNAGPLRPRVGVVNMQGHFDALWATPSTHPDNAVWADPLNPLSGSMGYDKSGYMSANNFEAQEIKNILAPQGADEKGSKPLEGKFFEMDIAKQIQFILDHNGQHGIAAVCVAGDGSTGKINLYAFEDGTRGNYIPGATSDPWTQDGNTTHLLLEIENGTLIPKYTPFDSSKFIYNIPLPNPCFSEKPTFRWHKNNYIINYKISFFHCNSCHPWEYETQKDTFLTPSHQLQNDIIRWCISDAFDPFFKSETLSTLIKFTSDFLPTIIHQEPDTILIQKPKLLWHQSPFITTYDIQIDTSGEFVRPINVYDINDTFYLPTIPLPIGRICWRVANRNRRELGYSEIDTFYIKSLNSTESNNNLLDNPEMLRSKPNPFNPSTEISFSCGASKRGSLKIYNANGKLIFGRSISGTGSLFWKPESVSSSLYICILKTESGIITKKLFLTK